MPTRAIRLFAIPALLTVVVGACFFQRPDLRVDLILDEGPSGCAIEIGGSIASCRWEGDIVIHNDGGAEANGITLQVIPSRQSADVEFTGTCGSIPAGGSCTFRLVHTESGELPEVNPTGTVTASTDGSSDSESYVLLV